jgi:S23 ribosomal protein.
MGRSIENLVVWKESRLFVNDIYRMMANCKDYGFKDQIQRAAVSIMNNIAEGSESGSDAKFLNFLNIARGSCSEVRSMLYLCEDFGICSADERIELQNQLKKISTGIVHLFDSISAQPH